MIWRCSVWRRSKLELQQGLIICLTTICGITARVLYLNGVEACWWGMPGALRQLFFAKPQSSLNNTQWLIGNMKMYRHCADKIIQRHFGIMFFHILIDSLLPIERISFSGINKSAAKLLACD